MMRKPYVVFSALVLGLSVQSALAQQYVYPKEGQSPQQQQQDEYACYQWAVQQTGFDPSKAAPPPPPAPAPSGGAARGALRGAAGGAIIGGIAGDAGKGAAAGAVMGGIGGAVKQSSAQQQQAAAQASSANNAAAAYERAKATCLQARGYVVN
jgi:hypothetical protein